MQIVTACRIPKQSKIYKTRLSTLFVITWPITRTPRGSLTTSVGSSTNFPSCDLWVSRASRESSISSWRTWCRRRRSWRECLPQVFPSEERRAQMKILTKWLELVINWTQTKGITSFLVIVNHSKILTFKSFKRRLTPRSTFL